VAVAGHAFLALEPEEACQAVARARRQANHDPTDRGAIASRSLLRIASGSLPTTIVRPAILKQASKVAESASDCGAGRTQHRSAIGLAAFLLLREHPDAVIGMFPSDHVIANEKSYRATIERGRRSLPEAKTLWFLASGRTGLRPATDTLKPEALPVAARCACAVSQRSPTREKAAAFVAAGNYFWNSGMFLWSARTLANALREHLPKTAPLLEEIAAAFGTRKFAASLRRLYPKCENHQYRLRSSGPRSAKGEREGNIFCLPTDFGWNDSVPGLPCTASHREEQSS